MLYCYHRNHYEHSSLLVLLDALTKDITVNSLNSVASLIKTAIDNDTLCFTLPGHVYCPVNGALLMRGVQICQPPVVPSFDGSLCGTDHDTFLQLNIDGC